MMFGAANANVSFGRAYGPARAQPPGQCRALHLVVSRPTMRSGLTGQCTAAPPTLATPRQRDPQASLGHNAHGRRSSRIACRLHNKFENALNPVQLRQQSLDFIPLVLRRIVLQRLCQLRHFVGVREKLLRLLRQRDGASPADADAGRRAASSPLRRYA
jgi:hypothetical protein